MATTYLRALGHFTANPDLRVLGLTATPDRLDGKDLGRLWQAAPFDYGIKFGIDNGWLVPVRQKTIHSSIDVSQVKVAKGDLEAGELGNLMKDEKVVHEIVQPALEHALDLGDGQLDESERPYYQSLRPRRTLIFVPTVAVATEVARVINNWLPGQAMAVSGQTPADERKLILDRYQSGDIGFVANVGVLTEGFDNTGIEAVVMARPTKSRALYTQCLGRGTRVLPDTIEGPWGRLETPELRKEAIAASAKPHVTVLDLVGNAGRHSLVRAGHILGAEYDPRVYERAAGADGDVMENLSRAAREIEEEDEQAKAEAERERLAAEERRRQWREKRRGLVMVGKVKSREIDPFRALGVTPPVNTSTAGRSPASLKQIEFLRKAGVPSPGNLSKAEAGKLIGEINRRRDQGLCTLKQAHHLKRHGYSGEMSKAEASRVLDEVFGKTKKAVNA
jgi:superfamily II DNA or RNA helicase